MIKGIGVDVVDITRFRAILKRWRGRFLDRLFTPQEQEDCLDRHDPAPHLAVRFAAKEAFSKAVGTGFGAEISPRNVEVIRKDSGAPRLNLTGGARQKMRALRATRALLSLSHDRGIGIAFVVLEGKTEGRGPEISVIQ